MLAPAVIENDDQAFQNALNALGLEGWPITEVPRLSRLWVSDGAGGWLFGGLMVESPEPIHRPDRLELYPEALTLAMGVAGSTVRFDIRRRDRLGSRLLYLSSAPFRSFGRTLLERDEPGIFNPHPPSAARPPEFRIRRAVGPVADPIYARSLVINDKGDTIGPLTWQAAAAPATVFSAMVTDDNAGRGLEPFVRYVYWAEVRLPPERRVPSGVPAFEPPGSISALDPASTRSHPRPMSLFSAPRVLMHVPQGAPASPSHDTVKATRAPPDSLGNIEVIIEIPGAPHAHVKAIGPYRLAVWSQWPEQAIEPVTIANGSPLDGTWPGLDEGGVISVSVHLPETVSPSSPLHLRLALIDPIGRMSNSTTITVS